MENVESAHDAVKVKTALERATGHPPSESDPKSSADGEIASQGLREAGSAPMSPGGTLISGISYAPVNWTDCPLYSFYTEKRALLAAGSEDAFQGDDAKYTEPEIDSVLELVKSNAQDYRKTQQVEAVYAKASSTLKFLLEEQAVDISRYQRVQELYKDISLENTLKLMLRCKLAFDGRRKVLALFQRVDEYEKRHESLKKLIEGITPKTSSGEGGQAGKTEVDKKSMDRIQQSTQKVLASAERVLKGIQDVQKKENSSRRREKDSSYQPDRAFLFRNVDLAHRVRTEMKDAEESVAQLCNQSGERQIHEAEGSAAVDENTKAEGKDLASKRSHGVSPPDTEYDPKEDASGSQQIAAHGSGQRRGDEAAVQDQEGSPRFRQAATTSPGAATVRKELQQTSQLQKQQMFKTAYEGFYTKRDSLRHQDRSKSKKKGPKRVKRRGNQSVHHSVAESGATPSVTTGTHHSYLASTPNAPHKSTTPADRASAYGKTNVTSLKTPLVGGDGLVSKGSDSTKHNMKQAMKRKIHLPNAMPRRVDVIYDLNGRPLYRGGYLRTVEDGDSATQGNSSSPNERVKYAGVPEAGDYPTDRHWNRTGGHDLYYGDGPSQTPSEQPKDLGLLAKAPGVQGDAARKSSLLHQIKQQRYPNGAGGKRLTPMFMRTEYTSGIFPRHGSLQPKGAPQPKQQAADSRILQLNQTSEGQLPAGLAKLHSGSRGQNLKQKLPDILERTLPAEDSLDSPGSDPDRQAAQQIHKILKPERPVAASEKAHLFNPRARRGPAAGTPGGEQAPSHLLPLGATSNRGLEDDDQVDGLGSMAVNRQRLNHSSHPDIEGEPSPKQSASNMESQAITGAAPRCKLVAGHQSAEQDEIGAGKRSDGSKRATQLLNNQAFAVDQRARGGNQESLGGVGQIRKRRFSRKLSPIVAMQGAQSTASRVVNVSVEESSSAIAPGRFVMRGSKQLLGAQDQYSARGIGCSKLSDQQFAEGHPDDSSQVDLSAYMSQTQQRFGQQSSPGRASHVHGQTSVGAVGSMYLGNSRAEHFTSQFSNVWIPPNDIMHHDSGVGSTQMRRERETRSLLFNLERQQQKQQALHEKQTKEALCELYRQRYGVEANSQQRFFLSPLRLRDLLIKKATDVTQDKAARTIQTWYRGIVRRQAFLQLVRDRHWATGTLQRRFRAYRQGVLIPRERRKREERSTWVIQRCLRGYQARRRCLYGMANMRVDKVYDEWHRIDVIARGHFQRRVRKAWLAHQERKAEKARLKAEAAAAKKPGYGRRRGATKAAPKPAPAPTPAAKPEPAATSPAKAPPAAKKAPAPTPAKDLAATTKTPPRSNTIAPAVDLRAQHSALPTVGAAAGEALAATSASAPLTQDLSKGTEAKADAQGGEPGSRGSNRSNDPNAATMKAGEASQLPAGLGEEAGQGSATMGGDQPGAEVDGINDRVSGLMEQEDQDESLERAKDEFDPDLGDMEQDAGRGEHDGGDPLAEPRSDGGQSNE